MLLLLWFIFLLVSYILLKNSSYSSSIQRFFPKAVFNAWNWSYFFVSFAAYLDNKITFYLEIPYVKKTHLPFILIVNLLFFFFYLFLIEAGPVKHLSPGEWDFVHLTCFAYIGEFKDSKEYFIFNVGDSMSSLIIISISSS